MKNMIKHLWLSVIDLTLILFFIAVLIRALINNWWFLSPYIVGGIAFVILYMLGVSYRIGSTWAIMNEHIKDDDVRRMYGMNPYEMRDEPIRTGLLDLIFKLTFLTGAVLIFIFKIIY